jgi:hypothetical protein
MREPWTRSTLSYAQSLIFGDSVWHSWGWSRFFCAFLRFSPRSSPINHCFILIYCRPLSYARALNRQYIITSSVCKFWRGGGSSLTPNFARYRVGKLVFFMLCIHPVAIHLLYVTAWMHS